MWSGVENAFVGFENYLSGKKSDFYEGQPTEEQMRLKRQQIKDQYIQATQEMRDRENPTAYQSPQIPINAGISNEEMLRLQRQEAKDRYIRSVESPPQTKDSFYIYPEDEARKAAIQQASIGFGPRQSKMQGPPVPDYLQEGYAPPKAEATGRRWDMSGPEPTLIEAPTAPAAQAASEPVSRGRQMVQEQESRPKTHNEIMAALPTEGDREEYKRVIIEKDKAAKLNKAIQYVMQAYPPEEQKHALEMYKEQINLPYAGMDIRRMEERPIFKTAVETFGQKYRDNLSVLASLRGQLERAKMITDPGEKKLFLQTEIPKMLNTIAVAAPDAVGVEEGRRIMAELQKYTSTPISEWASLAQDRGFTSAFTSDPDAFLKKVETLYKVSAKVNNEKTNVYYNLLGGKALQSAGGFFLDTNVGKGKDSPAVIEGLRTGEIKVTPALIKRFPEDTSISAPAPNQSMSRPLKSATISPTGVRMFGPTPYLPQEY
jgi:hypothetical protein